MSEVESVLIERMYYGDWELVGGIPDPIICDEFICKYDLGTYRDGTIAVLTIKKENNGLIHFRYIMDSLGVKFWTWSDKPILESSLDKNLNNTIHENLEDIIQKLSPKREPFRADIYLTEIPFSCSGKESMAFINMK